MIKCFQPDSIQIRPTPRYIIMKFSKIKDKWRILKTAREKKPLTYKRVPMCLVADFSVESYRPGKGDDIFKVWKEKYCLPRALCPAEPALRTKG
jgi:hypothetical protein